MAQGIRVYSGGDTVTWTVSGLTAGSLYNLYLYGMGGGANEGATFSLTSTFQAPTGIYSAETTDGDTAYTAADNNIWDSNGNVIDGPGSDPANIGNDAYGNAWVELNAEANSSGDLTFTESKETGGTDFLNGFQIQGVTATPEPSTFALAGLGLIGFITMNYRRRSTNR